MTVVSNFESLDQLEEMLKMGMGMGMGQIDGILGGQGGTCRDCLS